MRELERLRDMLCNEVKNITQHNEFTTATLDAADKIVDMIKDIDEINEKERMREYSEDASYGYWNNGYGRTYGNGHSYTNNGNRNNGVYRSYDSGYSRHTATEKMIDELQMMMDDASSQRDKDVIQRALEELRK